MSLDPQKGSGAIDTWGRQYRALREQAAVVPATVVDALLCRADPAEPRYPGAASELLRRAMFAHLKRQVLGPGSHSQNAARIHDFR